VLRDPNDREAIVRTAALAAVSEANNAKHCELAMHPASHQEKSIAARQRCPTLKSIRESGLMKLENSNARSYLFNALLRRDMGQI
jgi:hypothetical protein